MPHVEVELYGVPRLRAGVARVSVEGTTVLDVLRALGRACPALLDARVLHEGALHPAYRLSLNGEGFASDPSAPVRDGDVFLLLSADVGG